MDQLDGASGKLEVSLDGQWKSLSQWRETVLRHVGYVGSDFFIIQGSIRDTLSYGLMHPPSDSDCYEALEIADCSFVFTLPRGLNHELDDQGRGLSAGQLQRLSLARALLRKPKALILDEFTSCLDLQTESQVMQNLTQLKSKMTLIVATHRKEPLAFMDGILNLSNHDGSCSLSWQSPRSLQIPRSVSTETISE